MRGIGMGLIGTFALLGCAGSEPTQDAADEPAGAAESAPQEVEATALAGHKLSVTEKLDFDPSGRATLGVLMLDFRTKNDRLIHMECDAVALGARSVHPSDYVVAGIQGLEDREGVSVLLYEHDGKTPSDWSIACYTQLRKPFAREIMTAVQKSIAIDPT
jgi:hypothetical protein